MDDIYDSVFRTLLNDCSKMIIPIINEVFGEKYKGDEKIEFFPNEHFIAQQTEEDKKRITDSNFVIYGENGKKNYHWECQSTQDNKMLIRLFEYDAQIALDSGEINKETLTVTFPNSAVLYLRSTKFTPDEYWYIIKTPGGELSYKVPIMKVKSFSINDIFNKKLYMLIPFYIFTHESRLQGYEENEEKLQVLLNEYKDILTRIDKLLESGELGEFDKRTIVELSEDVLRQIAMKYQKVQKNVEEIMGGFIIETEAKRLLNQGIEKGIEKGKNQEHKDSILSSIKNIMETLSLTLEQAISALKLNEEDRNFALSSFSMCN